MSIRPRSGSSWPPRCRSCEPCRPSRRAAQLRIGRVRAGGDEFGGRSSASRQRSTGSARWRRNTCVALSVLSVVAGEQRGRALLTETPRGSGARGMPASRRSSLARPPLSRSSPTKPRPCVLSQDGTPSGELQPRASAPRAHAEWRRGCRAVSALPSAASCQGFLDNRNPHPAPVLKSPSGAGRCFACGIKKLRHLQLRQPDGLLLRPQLRVWLRPSSVV